MQRNNPGHIQISQFTGVDILANREEMGDLGQSINDYPNGIITFFYLGKPVMKSIPTSSHFHAGIAIGRRVPAGL